MPARPVGLRASWVITASSCGHCMQGTSVGEVDTLWYQHGTLVVCQDGTTIWHCFRHEQAQHHLPQLARWVSSKVESSPAAQQQAQNGAQNAQKHKLTVRRWLPGLCLGLGDTCSRGQQGGGSIPLDCLHEAIRQACAHDVRQGVLITAQHSCSGNSSDCGAAGQVTTWWSVVLQLPCPQQSLFLSSSQKIGSQRL